MRCIALNRAERISVSRARHRMARRSAMTRTSPTWLPGNTPALNVHRCCVRSPSHSSTCTSPSAATSSQEAHVDLTLKVWRQRNAADAGGFVTYQARGVEKHMSFLEMLDVLN